MKKGLGLAAAIAAFLALALPGSAAAVVYCVDDTPGDLGDNNLIHPSCETAAATIPDALSAAQVTGTVVDTVRIGPGDYDVLASAGAQYFTANPANNVSVIGAGTIETRLTLTHTAGSMTGLQIQAPAGSTVEDLSITIPANSDGAGDTGIGLFGGAAGIGLLIEGPAASNASGIRIADASELRTSTVALQITSPSNTAVRQTGGSPTVLDSELRANNGITTSGAGDTTRLERSVIDATVAAAADSGEIAVHDSIIDLGGRNDAVGVQAINTNLGTDPIAATVTGSTIVNGGSDSTGVRAVADSAPGPFPGDPDDTGDDGENAEVVVSSTVISGVTNALRVEADRGQTAELTTSYSNYDPATVVEDDDISNGNATGTTVLTETDQTDLEPGFADPGAGDYHLLPGSAMIDIGDPADPPFGATDLDGDPRALDGSNDCVSRRDIGADEVVAASPTAQFAGGPADGALVPSASPSYSFSSSRACAPAFQCSIDGAAAAACQSGDPIGPLSEGAHTIAVRALGELGDPGPETSRALTVDTVPPDTQITSGPSGLTGNAIPSFGFSSEPEATFQCRFDSQAFGPCSGPGATHKPGAPLADGPQTFEVRAIDAAGNIDPTPAARNLTVDTRAPRASIKGPAKVRTRKPRARVRFKLAADEAGSRLECKLNAKPFAPCVAAYRTPKLRRGRHTLRVRARDAAGNLGPPTVKRFRILRRR